MREQFQIVSQSDVIVYVHGAAMGNFPFLSPVCTCELFLYCLLLYTSAR